MIQKLTSEQENKLSVYKDKWLKIGLSCEPLNIEKSRSAVIKCYKVAGLKPPIFYFHTHSPISCCLMSLYLKAFFVRIKNTQVWAQVWAQVWDQIGDQIGDQVGDQVWDQVGAQVRAQVWDQIGDQIGDQVGAQVGAQIWGSQDSWLSSYDYCLHELELRELSKISPLTELALYCGWWAPYKGYAILQDRPYELHRDDKNRLHNKAGMAIKYRDGWGVYALNGVRVPEWLVLSRSEDLDPHKLTTINNAQVRAEFIRKIGIDRCWYKLAQVIDTRGHYELGLIEGRPYLKMLNPSVPELWHVEGVHPSCKSVSSSLLWRNGTNQVPIQLT